MRVIELNGRFLGEQAPVGVGPTKTAYEIGQRTGDQEILLHKAQALSLACGIVRIQNARERFGRQGFRERADEVAGAESLEVKKIRRRRSPEAERVDCLPAIPNGRALERNAEHALRQ